MTCSTAFDYNSNTFKNDQVKNVKFFSLPKDENFKRKWLANIKRDVTKTLNNVVSKEIYRCIKI